MKKALQDWLKKRGMPEIDVDNAQSLCSKLGLEGDKYDGCVALVWQLEKGDISEVEFTVGLGIIADKEPKEVAGMLKGVGTKPLIETEIASLEKIVTKGGRDISLIKEWVKAEGISQTKYLQKLREIVEDLSIPRTFVTSLGIEVEIPVAMAVEALAGEKIISSGFHGALNQRWTLVFEGMVSEKITRAAETAGLEVTYRGIFTDISLPNVGIKETEKATEVFNRFAELYEVENEPKPALEVSPIEKNIDLSEKLPIIPYTVGSERRTFYSPLYVRLYEEIPRYWYHVPDDKAQFGKQIKAYKIQEIGFADSFGKGYTEGEYVWLSPMSIYVGDAYIIDITKLDNDAMRFTGQTEGNILYRGNISSSAIVGIRETDGVIVIKE